MRKILLALSALALLTAAVPNPGAQSYTSIPASNCIGNPNIWADNPTYFSGCEFNFTLNAAIANATVGTLPANATITKAIARETAGHNVTISLGSTSGATDVLVSQALTASTSTIIPAASFAKNWFSSTATQAVFIDSASWSSASVNITVYYVVGP